MAFTVVGLGKAGKEYEETRHSVGRLFAGRFAEECGCSPWEYRKEKKSKVSAGVFEKEKIILVLPETFMNVSGSAVKHFVKSPAGRKKLIVIHDDLDLPIGTFKVSFNRGEAGHKGVLSLSRALRGRDFYRIRVGISRAGRGNQAKKVSGERAGKNFVLARFSKKELAALEALFAPIRESIGKIISGKL